MTTTRVLVTAFEPFGGESINPSREIVRHLVDVGPPDGIELFTAVLPVDRERYRAAIDAALAQAQAELVVCLGQATGRPQVDIESTAHNGLDFNGACDNGGHAATAESLEHEGPSARRSPLPVDALVSDLAGQGHAVGRSDDAGRHLCNAVYYEVLGRGCRALFVHVPLTPEQATRRDNAASLPLASSADCVRDLLSILARRRESLGL